MSLNGVSKHVKVLERAGLVQRRIEGREHWLRVNGEALQGPYEWLHFYRQFWGGRLDSRQPRKGLGPDPRAHDQDGGLTCAPARPREAGSVGGVTGAPTQLVGVSRTPSFRFAPFEHEAGARRT